MQPHEGPPRRAGQDEATRQRALTRKLLLAIAVLGVAVCVVVVRQQFI